MKPRHPKRTVANMSPIRHLAAVPEPVDGLVTVVVAEDHEGMRRSLRRLLEVADGIHVAAEAGDLALTEQHVAGHRPDVLVLGLNMPDGSSLELVEHLSQRAPATRVVVLSADDGPRFAERALAAGARGYVLKERADTDLAEAV